MSWLKTLALSLLITAFGLPHSSISRPISFDKYDDCIESSVRKYWSRFGPWQWWKAQLFQESRFDPNAVSPVGATGLAQFMPGTWADVQRQLGWSGINPRAACPAIEAGAYYMAKLHQTWRAPRPAQDRHFLAMASYNAGAGNIIKSQRICFGSILYSEVIQCLPEVTGRHSHETLTYVERIQKWFRQIMGR